MKHVFWKWKMDLVLLLSLSVLGYHSQGYMAYQGVSSGHCEECLVAFPVCVGNAQLKVNEQATQ
jgi:hypothetical protein